MKTKPSISGRFYIITGVLAFSMAALLIWLNLFSKYAHLSLRQRNAILKIERKDGGVDLDENGEVVKVYLVNHRFNDSDLQFLKDLPYLSELWIEHANITDDGLKHIGEIRNLNELWFRDLQISDAGLRHFEGLDDLERVTIRDCRFITGFGLKYLRNSTRLSILELIGCGITDAGLAQIKTLESVRTLSLSGNNISDDGLEHLTALHNLEYLFLENTKVSKAGVTKLQSALPKCEIYSSTVRLP